MADYTRGTGNSGTMMIRDHAPGAASGTVEFWITSNNGTTFDHEMPWAYTINGSYSGMLEHNYNAGSGWNLLGSWNITYSQTVGFYLGATGTSGLGGPTSFEQWIQRATVPAAPNAPTISNIQPQSMDLSWVPNSNGGAAITNYEIKYGLTAGAETFTATSSTTTKTITGLTPGTTYFFKVRAQNSVGWSGYSGNSSAMTIAGSRIKVAGVYVFAVPYVKDGGIWKLAKPYVKDAGTWKETI
jgi:hypothetical protein